MPGTFRQLIDLQLHHMDELQERIEERDRQISRWHSESKASQRLMAIPCVGIVTATAMIATVGDARQFRIGISKRGDVYLRTLLIHGARSALHASERRADAQDAWLVQIMRRRHKNIAAVALAHKRRYPEIQ